MELEHEKPDSTIYVKHYAPQSLQLSTGVYSHGLIFTKDEIIDEKWMVAHADELEIKYFIPMIKKNADIYILGTGQHMVIPKPEILGLFARAGKSLDFMSSPSACRTFNVLANDARNIIAAIIC